jgi:excisionase family DNA binding protein
MAEKTKPRTMTVPEAGWEYLGLSRNAAYDAAARGEIPTIKVGKLLRVPIVKMEKMLDEV